MQVPNEVAFVDPSGKQLVSVEKQSFYSLFEEPLFLNTAKIKQLEENLQQQLYKPPENAKVDSNGSIVQAKTGQELNRYEFEKQLRGVLYAGKRETLQVPVKEVHPRVTAELLSEIKSRKIGSYITYYPKGNKERTHNIKLASQAIDSYVVFPKETFSFNQVVGERTEAKGYQQAPVIIEGEFAEDIGGGICQVSSTLFNAVNLKGIEIVERHAHSRRVPYVPFGKDATVSWWGPDFVFRNVYNQPILIRAQAYNGKMAIDIYSAEDVRPAI